MVSCALCHLSLGCTRQLCFSQLLVFFYSWVAQAADAESSESKWSKEDIVELVGMLLAVPAGLVALAMLASYVKRIRERSNGKRFVTFSC